MTRQPLLFEAEPIDRAALAELAARSVPRRQLARTHRNLLKSTDLNEFGYTVSHWVRVGSPGSELLEFNPWLSDLPRVTVDNYADQAEVHRAIGARVVGPGRRFRK